MTGAIKNKDSRKTTARPPGAPEFIVGIGASAGGLGALEKFFDHMAPDSGVAFVLIQHLSPDFKSLMDDLLARRTSMAIHRVTSGTVLEADSIYLIPPKSHMTVADGRLFLTERAAGHHLELPIDVFFASLAREQRERSIGIVLSGTGSDGSRGIRNIHEAGGLVLVQSVESAQFDGMPRSALMTGVCDLVLAPEQMPEVLLKYVQASPEERKNVVRAFVREENAVGEYRQIFSLLRNQYNIDFAKYKPPTVDRRIQRRMDFAQVEDPAAYAALLAGDPREQDALYRDLLIGVTEFFRDPAAFDHLAGTVVPELFTDRGPDEEIRVWTAGCATGEEAYSLAILLNEEANRRGYRGNLTIFATDVHRSSLETASQGLFERDRLKNVSPERLAKYFDEEGDGRFRISKNLRRMIVFAPHNLISDPPFTRMDLVCCRNLLIYLQPDIQEKVLSLFHFALRKGGWLFLGSSEGLGKLAGEFETVSGQAKLFRKIRDLRIALDMGLEPATQRFPAPMGMPAPHLNVSLDRKLLHDYDTLLARYVPGGILVDQDRRILHCFGDAGRILGPPRGRMENDILSRVPDSLQIPLSTSLHRAARDCTAVTTRNLRLATGERTGRYDLSVECLADPRSQQNHFFIALRPRQETAPAATDPPAELAALTEGELPQHLQERVVDLEQELQATKESLQTTIEELQTSNEELQATNEELLAANEELQSTNEELHSVNEELYTVNAEFELKNKELKQLNQDHENLLASTQTGTVYLDRNLCIRKFSPAIEKIFRLLPQDIGRPIDHIAYHLARQQEMLEDVRKVLASGDPIEREVATNDGKWLLKRVLPFRDENGQVAGVVLTFTDISGVKAAEEALARMNQELEKMVAQRTGDLETARDLADRANAAKSSFLANMSHEIRTPMNGIFGTVQLLETTELTEEQQNYVNTLRTSAGNLLAIIDDLLDFSKIEAGKMDLDAELFAIASLVEEVTSLHRSRPAAAALSLTATLGPEVPELLVGDALRLKQVLSNLLSNAVKFTPEGRVELQVSLDSRDENGHILHFQVRDTGIGLGSAGAPDIFEPFTQGDSSVTRRFGGTGLGLAICRQIVELMGGRIWAEPNVDRGTTFHFTARFEHPAERAAAGPPANSESAEKTMSRNADLEILVAEDDTINQELILFILRKLGYSPALAENGRQVLELVKAKTFDLIFMDISMPEVDGLTATRTIRELPEDHPVRQVPIIALTAHALNDDRERILAAGVDEILTKPFTMQALQDAVARHAQAAEA